MVVENIPWRQMGWGAEMNQKVPAASRRPSKSPKIKVLFLTMGPPAAAPNWLRWRNGLASPALLAKKLLASSWLFRRNSNKVPCRLLVPERIVALISAPALRPNSAEYALV